MNTCDEWTSAACAELGIDEGLADQQAILDLAREVAHRVDRPAAPLTTFLLGVAIGRGEPAQATADRLLGLAVGWKTAD